MAGVMKLFTGAGAVFVFLTAFVNAFGADEPSAMQKAWSSMEVRKEHPRIWLDAERLAFVRGKVEGKSVAEVRQLSGPSAEGLALVYAITGDESTGREAAAKALEAAGRNPRSAAVTVSLVYDWCFPLLSADEKAAMQKAMIETAKADIAFKRVWRSFHNGLYSTGWRVTAAALALYGDDPYGAEALDFLKDEFDDVIKTFEKLFADGEWPESFDYNRHVTYDALRFFSAIKSATGVDFLAGSDHAKNTSLFILYASKPNGLVYNGDDNDWPFVGNWEREAIHHDDR